MVHCEKGQRRSASVLLSWLCAHRMPLQEAIDKIDATYAGEEENWGEAYRQHRVRWIDTLLSNWEKKHKSLQKKWILNPKNKNCILDWKSILLVDQNDENEGQQSENPIDEVTVEENQADKKNERKKTNKKKSTTKPKPRGRKKKLTLEEEVAADDKPLEDLLLEDMAQSKKKTRKRKNSAVEKKSKDQDEEITFKPSRLKRNRATMSSEDSPPAKKQKI